MHDDSSTSLSILDEEAIRSAPVQFDPYEYAYVDQAMRLEYREAVLADAPEIPARGSYGLPQLRYGPAFGQVIGELLSARFRSLVEEKFDIDLSNRPPVILMMGNTTGHYNEGHAHPDSASARAGPMNGGGSVCCAQPTVKTSPSNFLRNTARC
jgi:hypothetical protein